MNIFSTCAYRLFQKVLYLASFFLDYKPRQRIEGNNAPEELANTLYIRNLRRPFVLIDPVVREKGLADPILNALRKAGMKVTLFDQIKPNPTLEVASSAADKYVTFTCDCLLAIGGGSTIDTAKAAGIAIAYPGKNLASFKGVLKVHRQIPYLVAVPTTAGTGSEATLATVVVDKANDDKFQIDDPKLTPSLAFFYPPLLTSLPPSIIASTGMDAFTHAIEAYIGKSNTKQSKQDAEKAMVLIHRYLYKFYKHPRNEAYAEDMLLASYHAGRAFSKAYVGYVHALAHGLGGKYNLAHGYANAVLLPIVLKAYGKSVYQKLAAISDLLELAPKEYKNGEKARNFIAYLENLNSKMGLPRQFDHVVKEEDVVWLSRHAAKEGNPLYPVPRCMNAKELAKVLKTSDITWGYRS